MAEIGIDQGDLADAANVTQGTISLILTAKTKNSRHWPAIARAVSVNMAWLLGDTDTKVEMFDLAGEGLTEEDLPNSMRSQEFRDARVSLVSIPSDATIRDRKRAQRGGATEDDDDTVYLDELDMRFGLGGAYLDGHVTSHKRRFSRAWLRHFTHASPDYIKWALGDGDSMEPTIRSGEPVVIDTSNVTPQGDGIWACVYGEVSMIKRLRPLPDGSIEIHSDNQFVPSARAYDGELHVFGRVVAVVRRL